jgi:hypothetical protein
MKAMQRTYNKIKKQVSHFKLKSVAAHVVQLSCRKQYLPSQNLGSTVSRVLKQRVRKV